jgi:hypothetical protein
VVVVSKYDQKLYKIAKGLGFGEGQLGRELANDISLKYNWSVGVGSDADYALLENLGFDIDAYANDPDSPRAFRLTGQDASNRLRQKYGDTYGNLLGRQSLRSIVTTELSDEELVKTLGGLQDLYNRDADFRSSESENNSKVEQNRQAKTGWVNTLGTILTSTLLLTLSAGAIQSILEPFSGAGFTDSPKIPGLVGTSNYDPLTGKTTTPTTYYTLEEYQKATGNYSATRIPDQTPTIGENTLSGGYSPADMGGSGGASDSSTLFGDLTPSVNPLGMPEKNDQVFASINDTKLPQVKQFASFTPKVVNAPEATKLFGSF